MTIDVHAVRADTPGCEGPLAYLNNAGSALPSRRTLAAMTDHLALEAAVGGYEAAATAADALAAVRASAARLVNGASDEIAITQSDSASFAKAVWGLALGGALRSGDRVAVDRITYNSHYLALLQMRDHLGIVIEQLPGRADGATDLDAAVASIDAAPPALVCLTLIGTHNGLVNDVAPVGAAAQAHGVPVVLDACQAVGQLPLDVSALRCDVLTGTGRKFLRGPRGTGLLWMARSLHGRCTPPGIDGHSATWIDAARYELADGAARFEEFEVSFAGQLGLGAAIDQALELGIEAISDRALGLAERLRGELAELPGAVVHDGNGRRCAIVTFSVAGHSPASIAAAARAADVSINVSSSPYARLDMGAKGIDEVVRASPHYYNTDTEIDRLLAVLRSL